MKNHWKNNISYVTEVTYETLIKPVKNEHFRWSVSGKGAPCPDRSRCRCVQHRAPRATRFGNAHFRSNALVAPSGWEAQPQADSEINMWGNHHKYNALGDMVQFFQTFLSRSSINAWKTIGKGGAREVPWRALVACPLLYS